jgi:signal transduction histidine kinase
VDDKDHLRELIHQVPLFAGLTAAECNELYDSSQRLVAEPGDLIIEEGAPGETMFIVLSGELEVTKRDGGREIVLATRQAGEFLGEMALLEKVPRSASVRAVKRTELLSIGPEAFHSLLLHRPLAATTVLRTVAARLRSTEASLVQSDKLASLGTLAAGLAHELNNPAAAIQRSVGTLRQAIGDWHARTMALDALGLPPAQRERAAALAAAQEAVEPIRPPSRVESKLTDRLDELGVADSWEAGPSLAAFGWTAAQLDPLVAEFDARQLPAVLGWLGAGAAGRQLVGEIGLSAKAISTIVSAVKSYAYLDQAPVQDVDLASSLEDTLVILNHKLKHGIIVERDFDPGVPRIEAYAGELNQVWTNIIDNAVQAMDGKGTLKLCLHRLGEEVEVRITDSGPGIPHAIAARIFDPFFTTKPQGVGTGLGLHIARNIVVNRHRGRIEVASEPGRTEFRIVLPTRLGKADKS